MSEEQRMIIDATANMSTNQLREILTFIQYIQFKSKKVEVPERLVINSEEDLIKKIDGSYENMDKAISLEDAVAEIEKIYAK